MEGGLHRLGELLHIDPADLCELMLECGRFGPGRHDTAVVKGSQLPGAAGCQGLS